MKQIMNYLFGADSVSILNLIKPNKKIRERERFIDGLWTGTAYKMSK